MCQDVCIEINEVVENISIEVRDFSVSNIISQDDGNAVVVGEDGLLFVPENESIGTVTSVNSILPDVNGNVVVPIPTVPDFATELEVNVGVVSNKTIAPNTLANWWVYQKGLIQTFAQKITFTLGALFTPQATPTHERGRVYFDDVNDCLAYMDSISGTSVQVGQEMIMRVRNNTGATILNGAVVYVSGAIGQNSTIALAQANAMPTSEIIGIATHDIPNNTIGKVCVFGQVNDLDTSAFSDGNAVFLSSSVAGGLVVTPPISPNFVVAIGIVEHAHPTQGKIIVRPQRALANNNSLGTSQSISATQNAVKTYADTKLSNDISTYTPATTPLVGTELALIDDGTGFKKVAVSEFGGGIEKNHLDGTVFFTDFDGYGTNNNFLSGDLFLSNAGGGGNAFVSSTSNFKDALRLINQTTSTSIQNLTGGTSLYNGLYFDFETLHLADNLSNGTNNYRLIIGLSSDQSTTNTTNGIYFYYDKFGTGNIGIPSDNYLCVCKVGSNISVVDSGVEVSSSTPKKLRFEKNNTDSEVKFFIDNNLVATITTNIPVIAMRKLIVTQKTLGTGSVENSFDYLYYKLSGKNRV